MAALAGFDNLVSFSGNPLDHEGCIVLAQEVVVQRLLSKECADEIFESNQSVLILIKDLHLLKFTEHSKHLKQNQHFIKGLTFSRSSSLS